MIKANVRIKNFMRITSILNNHLIPEANVDIIVLIKIKLCPHFD